MYNSKTCYCTITVLEKHFIKKRKNMLGYQNRIVCKQGQDAIKLNTPLPHNNSYVHVCVSYYSYVHVCVSFVFYFVHVYTCVVLVNAYCILSLFAYFSVLISLHVLPFFNKIFL